MNQRRQLLKALGLYALGGICLPARALMAENPPLEAAGLLSGEQSDLFRAWMTLIVADQVRRGPSPRWYHRDCAGLARFAVTESLRVHDQRWRKNNGFEGKRLPPELDLLPEQREHLKTWATIEGDRQAFVTAIALIQKNSRFISKETVHARPGDLLFFDQGEDQHLMIWMGSWIAYHTGQPPPIPAKSGKDETQQPVDNGLRAVAPAQLMQWKDTRWRISENNPNFVGFYRLAFLSR